MQKRENMKTLTIRGIDDKLSKALKEKAKKNNISLNQTALKILKEGSGIKEDKIFKTYDDLNNLAGTWTEEDEKEFVKNTYHFNKIDKDIWK